MRAFVFAFIAIFAPLCAARTFTDEAVRDIVRAASVRCRAEAFVWRYANVSEFLDAHTRDAGRAPDDACVLLRVATEAIGDTRDGAHTAMHALIAAAAAGAVRDRTAVDAVSILLARARALADARTRYGVSPIELAVLMPPLEITTTERELHESELRSAHTFHGFDPFDERAPEVNRVTAYDLVYFLFSNTAAQNRTFSDDSFLCRAACHGFRVRGDAARCTREKIPILEAALRGTLCASAQNARVVREFSRTASADECQRALATFVDAAPPSRHYAATLDALLDSCAHAHVGEARLLAALMRGCGTRHLCAEKDMKRECDAKMNEDACAVAPLILKHSARLFGNFTLRADDAVVRLAIEHRHADFIGLFAALWEDDRLVASDEEMRENTFVALSAHAYDELRALETFRAAITREERSVDPLYDVDHFDTLLASWTSKPTCVRTYLVWNIGIRDIIQVHDCITSNLRDTRGFALERLSNGNLVESDTFDSPGPAAALLQPFSFQAAFFSAAGVCALRLLSGLMEKGAPPCAKAIVDGAPLYFWERLDASCAVQATSLREQLYEKCTDELARASLRETFELV